MKNILFSIIALLTFLIGCIMLKLLFIKFDGNNEHPLIQLLIASVLFVVYCVIFGLIAKSLGIFWEDPPI